MGYIELKQVTKNFGDLQVIKPLDLEIKDGEFTVFVGLLVAGNPPVKINRWS